MMQHGVQILALGLLAGLSVALLFSEARIVELSGGHPAGQGRPCLGPEPE